MNEIKINRVRSFIYMHFCDINRKHTFFPRVHRSATSCSLCELYNTCYWFMKHTHVNWWSSQLYKVRCLLNIMHHHTIILFKIKTRFIFIGSVMLLDFLSLCARCCEYQYQKKVKWQYNQQMIFVVSGTAVRLYWTLWKSFILICTLA